MNLPKPSLAGAAGGGWRREVHPNVQPGLFSLIFSDLPLPRRGVLSGKSPRTSRRWRLFFVRFVILPLCLKAFYFYPPLLMPL